MDQERRKEEIIERLRAAGRPVSASALAGNFGVSRQIIVGDIAVLRAKGHEIMATPRGYLLADETGMPAYQVACRHKADQILDELNAIVDCGGCVVDVIVEHPLYGELVGKLEISNRLEAADFAGRVTESGATPLSLLTGGVHLHTIRCRDSKTLKQIRARLRGLDLLFE